jgi:hypothetical protein
MELLLEIVGHCLIFRKSIKAVHHRVYGNRLIQLATINKRLPAVAHTVDEAKKLFSQAEARDTATNNVSDMYKSIADDAALAVEAMQLALGLAPVPRIKDQNPQDAVAGLQFFFQSGRHIPEQDT